MSVIQTSLRGGECNLLLNFLFESVEDARVKETHLILPRGFAVLFHLPILLIQVKHNNN